MSILGLLKRNFLLLTLLLLHSYTFGQYVSFSTSNLPIIKIDTDGANIPYDYRIPAKMQIINNEFRDNNINDTPTDYDGNIEIKIRGQSSRDFAKKSFRIETHDTDGNPLNVAIMGMPKENDWVLYGPYADKTLMRNALIYTLSREINSYAPRVKFCEVVINNNYNGIYLFTEKIKRDKDRINITKLTPNDNTSPEITGGYIFKKDKTDAGDNLIYLNNKWLEIAIIEPKPKNITQQQTNWLRNYLNAFENALYKWNRHEDFMDMESFVDNFLFVEFAKNIDGFRFSTYFHKDRGGKIVALPVWDYNLSLGNADYNDGWRAQGWYYPHIRYDNNWWNFLVTKSEFMNLCAERWAELRQHHFTTEHIFEKIDNWAEELEEAQVRNFRKFNILGRYVWPNPGFPQSGSYDYNSPKYGGAQTFEEEIDILKDFITQRISWIDSQFKYTSIYNIEDYSSIKLYDNYPNPFYDKTVIEYSIKETTNIKLSVYDILGNKIEELVNKLEVPGKHKATIDGSKYSKGVYIFQLKSDNFIESKRMLKN